MAELIEFKNGKGETLRGLLDRAEGSRQALVFVHGLGATSTLKTFRPIREAFLGRASIFRFDLSGSGMSDGELKDLTVKDQAAELGLALDALEAALPGAEVDLVAMSLGAAVAARYVGQHPSRVRRVVLLAPALNMKELVKYWYVRDAAKEAGQGPVAWADYPEGYSLVKATAKVATGRYVWADTQTSHKPIGRPFFTESFAADFQADVKKLDQENILIVHGDADATVPAESVDALPDARRVDLPGANHLTDHPRDSEAFVPEVEKFLST